MADIKEDTVSADRKERIIFDPNTGKSRKISSVVSRQNFNNTKYGNRKKEGDINFLTGTEQPKEVKEEVKSFSQYKGLEKEKKMGLPTAIVKKSENAVSSDTVEGWDHPHKAVGKEKVTKPTNEGTEMEKLTFKQFMEQIDEYVEFVEEEVNEDYGWDHPEPKTTASNVRKIQGTRYGGSKQADDNAHEDWYSKKEKPEADAPKAEAPAAPEKRGRGRPKGSYGTYKARSAETRAAAAAKAAASKAANKAKK